MERLTPGQRELLDLMIELTQEYGHFPGENRIAQELDADRCIQQLKSMAKKGYVEQCGPRGPWKPLMDHRGFSLIWEFDGGIVSVHLRGPAGIKYKL